MSELGFDLPEHTLLTRIGATWCDRRFATAMLTELERGLFEALPGPRH